MKPSLDTVAKMIDLQKAKFDITLIEQDLERFPLCEASINILKGSLAGIKTLVEHREKLDKNV